MKTLAFRRISVSLVLTLLFSTCVYAQIIVSPDADPVEWKDRYVTLDPGVQGNISIAMPQRSGYTVIVWEDNRNTGLDPDAGIDIYAQLIDNTTGVPQWVNAFSPPAGIGHDGQLVCGADFDQLNPKASYDSLNGVIITWEDYRSGYAEIYAARLDLTSGVVQWETRVTEYGITQGAAVNPKIAGVPNGAYIVWEDSRIGIKRIYGQYLLSDYGQIHPSWTVNGNQLSGGLRNDRNPEIVADNKYWAVGADRLIGFYLVYEQYISSNFRRIMGAQCTPAAVVTTYTPLENMNYDAGNPKLVPTGGEGGTISQSIGAFAAWELYYSSTVTYIRANKLSPFAQPITLTSTSGTRGEIALDANPTASQYCWVAWSDNRNAATTGKDIYANAFDMSTGNLLYGVNTNRAICTSRADQDQPSVELSYSYNAPGTCVSFAWRGSDGVGSSDIYQQQIRLNAAYTNIWQSNGTQVTKASMAQSKPLLSYDVVVFEDARAGNLNIYSQVYGTECNIPTYMGWQGSYVNAGVKSWDDVTDYDAQTWEGYTYVAWERGGTAIYIQKMDANGVPQWMNGGVELSTYGADPAVSFDGLGGAFVAWEDLTNAEVVFNHIDANGTLSNANPISLLPGATYYSNPDLVWRPANGGTNERAWCAVYNSAFGITTIFELWESSRVFSRDGGPCTLNFGPVIDYTESNGEYVAASFDPATGEINVITATGGPTPTGLYAINDEFDVCGDHYAGGGYLVGKEAGLGVMMMSFDANAALGANIRMDVSVDPDFVYHPSIASIPPYSDAGSVAIAFSYQPDPVNAPNDYQVRTTQTVFGFGCMVPNWNTGFFANGEAAVIAEITMQTPEPPRTDIIGLMSGSGDPTSMIAWDQSSGCGTGAAVKVQLARYTYNQLSNPPLYSAIQPYTSYYWAKGGESVARMLYMPMNQSRPILNNNNDNTLDTQFGALFFMDDRTGINNVIGSMVKSYPGVFDLVKESARQESVVLDFTLEPSYPNPVSVASGTPVTMSFALDADAFVTMKVYNMLGECVATLMQDQLTAGRYNVPFNLHATSKPLSTGTYFYSLSVDGRTLTKTLSIIE